MARKSYQKILSKVLVASMTFSMFFGNGVVSPAYAKENTSSAAPTVTTTGSASAAGDVFSIERLTSNYSIISKNYTAKQYSGERVELKMDKIFAKTRELGQALLESEVYAKMKEAEAKAMQNMEAAEMMANYLEKRQQIQAMMEDENPDPGVMKRLSDEMDEIQEKLQMIDDITNLTIARSEFNQVIGQINQVLQFVVTGRMDEADGGCGGDCGGCTSCDSCSGCH